MTEEEHMEFDERKLGKEERNTLIEDLEELEESGMIEEEGYGTVEGDIEITNIDEVWGSHSMNGTIPVSQIPLQKHNAFEGFTVDNYLTKNKLSKSLEKKLLKI